MSEPLQISVHVAEKRYQPTQEKTVIPGWDAKMVTPDRGYALSKVTVEGMPEPTETETFTENGEYNVGRIGTAIVDVDMDLQDKTVTPTEQTQTVAADSGYDGLDTVTVNPIPPEYVVPTGSVDITANGTVSVSGKATANVNVPQGVFPSGTKVITENVTGEDVTNYAAVDVAVPGPSGTKQISITQNGTTTEDVSEYADAEITVNTLPAKGLVFDDYDSDGYPHSAKLLGSWETIQGRMFYYYFSKDKPAWSYYYDTYGKNITHFDIPDTVTEIASGAFGNCSALNTINFPNRAISIADNAFGKCENLSEVKFLDDVTFTGTQVFYWCYHLINVIFSSNVNQITNRCFENTPVELYDFSHCTAIPPLFSAGSLSHASGCVIRIPAALSDTTLGEGNGWESATNWSALTDIVWEVV